MCNDMGSNKVYQLGMFSREIFEKEKSIGLTYEKYS
jgi:hypothetical protein